MLLQNVVSVVLLFVRNPVFVAALLLVQVIYKTLTLFTTGPSNPVVISNILIAVFHSITLVLIIQNRNELN